MIIRIVKLSFREEEIPTFKSLFERVKKGIKNFEGCQKLSLLQDVNQNNVFFTYSHWDDESALEMYRKSDFFQSTWSETKKLFSAKPEAWSTSNYENV